MLEDERAEGVDGEDQPVPVVAHCVPRHVARVAQGREPLLDRLVNSLGV